MRYRDATIRQKLTWMSALASTIALLLASSAFSAYHVMTFRSTIARTLAIQADTVGLNSISALRFNDDRSAEETLSALRADRNIISAAIYSADGKLFAVYSAKTGSQSALAPTVVRDQADVARFENGALEVFHGILADGERVGTVYLTYSLDDLFADFARYVGIALLVLAVSV